MVLFAPRKNNGTDQTSYNTYYRASISKKNWCTWHV